MLKKIKRFFITTFIGGVIVILPITIFVVIINLLFTFVQQLIRPVNQLISFGKITDQLIIDLISIGIILLFCFSVGLFVRTQFGKQLFLFVEAGLLSYLPFYDTIKETVEQFAGTNGNSAFSRAVIVDLYGNETRMTGFITDELDNGYFTVFVPTGPNPTNGLIFHVPENKVEFLDASIEETMRSVIGVGAGSSKIIYSKNNKFNK